MVYFITIATCVFALGAVASKEPKDPHFVTLHGRHAPVVLAASNNLVERQFCSSGESACGNQCCIDGLEYCLYDAIDGSEYCGSGSVDYYTTGIDTYTDTYTDTYYPEETDSPTSSSKSSSKKPGKGLAGKAIVGLVVGIIALLALIVGGVFAFLKRRRNKASAVSSFTFAPSTVHDGNAYNTAGVPEKIDPAYSSREIPASPTPGVYQPQYSPPPPHSQEASSPVYTSTSPAFGTQEMPSQSQTSYQAPELSGQQPYYPPPR